MADETKEQKIARARKLAEQMQQAVEDYGSPDQMPDSVDHWYANASSELCDLVLEIFPNNT